MELDFRIYDEKTCKYVDSSIVNGLMVGYINASGLFDIEQFTGLHDDNDKKIYEYDILKIHRISLAGGKDNIGYVKYFPDNGFGFITKDGIWTNWKQEYWSNSSKQVVGNIHENPEYMMKAVDQEND